MAGHLNALACGPPGDASGVQVPGHRPDVRLEGVEVQQQRWRVKLVQRPADGAQ